MPEVIRPFVQRLIDRGQVEYRELDGLLPVCNAVESAALIPAWTNSSFSRALERTLISLRFITPPPSPWWTLYYTLQKVRDAVDRPIGKAYATELATELATSLAGIREIFIPITAPTGYLLRAFTLATDAERRLANWPLDIPSQN